MRKTMRKAALVVFIAAFASQADAASRGGIKLLNSIPDAYWGTWALDVESCKDGNMEAIVLSAKTYGGRLGRCDIASVSETSSPKGPVYSARLRCADPRKTQNKTLANLIIRPGDANQIFVGAEFENLRAYQRCPESTPTSR